MSFDPLKAVHIHAHGARTLDTGVIGVAEEENLLIHACGFGASRQVKLRELSPEGELLFRADADPVLSWTVRATVLQWAGLADAHPGPLSRQALVFANGGRIPHQFLPFRSQYDGEEPGILFYEDPDTGRDGGDTPEISFRVALEFSDLDTESHAGYETLAPGGWTLHLAGYTPGEPIPEQWTELPVQTAAALTEACREAIEGDVFLSETNFDAAPITLRFYNGDPAGAGVAVTDALDLSVWTDLTEPVDPGTTVIKNHAALEWGAEATERSATHVRWARNGVVVADKALAAPLTIPAFHGLRVPIGALALQLEWPWDGGGSVTRPARLALRYLFGDGTTGINDTAVMTVKCWDADPNAGGALLDSFDVGRYGAFWLISGSSYVSNPADFTGTNAADPGGWTTEYTTVELAGVSTWFIKKAGTIVTAEGFFVTIPTGALDVLLA